MEYLNDLQHYIDQYDLQTIKDCLESLDVHTTVYKEVLASKEGQKFSPGDKAKGSNWLSNQYIFSIQAQRYKNKEETIQKWMERDRILQNKFDTTPLPRGITCSTCHCAMTNSMKHMDSFDEPYPMMFLFACPKCKKKKWINEDGSEHITEPIRCPKCKSEANLLVLKEEKDKVTWETNCPKCGFKEITTDDFAKSNADRKKKLDHDKKLLETYRDKFCSDEKGKEMYEYIEALKVANIVYEEEVKKYDSTAYQKISKLKKLTIIELEKLISESTGKLKYQKLVFESPQLTQHIIVSFSIQEADPMRKKEDSISQLQKIIKDLLEGTNWRLMSDGISYRLGFLTGRLKGYENEEDLLALEPKVKEEKPSKLDYETRMKYEGHNVVQLAHVMGEINGIKNMRKRRLEKEPEGFFLEETEGYYTCGVCGDATPSNKIWWNLDGLRCADCQRNIKEGVIPVEIHKNDELYIKDWQMSSYYNLRGSTVKKLIREGMLHPRELKRVDGSVYFTAYLVSENQEFVKKYPKTPRPKMFITDLLGNKIEL